MKLLYKIVCSVVSLLVVLYYSGFYVLPSITIVNRSAVGVAQAEIDLPGSHLDFGSIASGSSNALHYSLTQSLDGLYHYKIKFTDSVETHGSCGYVTDNEFNKRVVISIESDNQISCEQR
ncbi:hypothetical protein [Rheinheimera sp. MM224]|uniref:hypothetical protein n=1 Tax=Rheinheimera sp. MM224 TaxID=3019969 RepID=UPI0021F884E0|nr:hypothetical protein [Rheinheimera sp. MM224]CAI3802148.1 hypothetical protein JAMGFMIE_03027 [Rheinheimera sp. MM224]